VTFQEFPGRFLDKTISRTYRKNFDFSLFYPEICRADRTAKHTLKPPQTNRIVNSAISRYCCLFCNMYLEIFWVKNWAVPLKEMMPFAWVTWRPYDFGSISQPNLVATLMFFCIPVKSLESLNDPLKSAGKFKLWIYWSNLQLYMTPK